MHPEPETVLVVEPETSQQAIAIDGLQKAGLRASVAASGRDALAALADVVPEAILVDWDLPDMTAADLLADIASNARLGSVPAIVIVSPRDPGRIDTAVAAGALDVIRKPLDAAELRARVGAALRAAALGEECRLRSVKDPLTGLLNRRAILERFGEEFDRAHRYTREMAVAIVDVDHFGYVCETYGRPVGDRLLVQLAEYLTESTRSCDFVARWNDDSSFMLVLPETPLDAAGLVLERIRRELPPTIRPPMSNGGAMTISAGVVAPTPGRFRSPAGLLQAAQEELQAAKAAGRNRVSVLGTGPLPVIDTERRAA